jgi:hypothetical protein
MSRNAAIAAIAAPMQLRCLGKKGIEKGYRLFQA